MDSRSKKIVIGLSILLIVVVAATAAPLLAGCGGTAADTTNATVASTNTTTGAATIANTTNAADNDEQNADTQPEQSGASSNGAAPAASKPVKIRLITVNPEVTPPGASLNFAAYVNGRSNTPSDVDINIYRHDTGALVKSLELAAGGCGPLDDCEWKGSAPAPLAKGVYTYEAKAKGSDGSSDALSGVAYTFCVGTPSVDCAS